MPDGKKEGALDPEEIQADEALKSKAERKAEDIRSIYVKDYGFEEDDPRLDKLVEREIAKNKAVSTAISQKINWREKALKGPEKKEEPKEQEKPKPDEPKDDAISKELEEIVLGDYSSDTRAEIKKYAKLNNLTLREAKASEYGKYVISKEETRKKEEEASISRTNKGKTDVDLQDKDIKDIDVSTPEGRKLWEKWKAKKLK